MSAYRNAITKANGRELYRYHAPTWIGQKCPKCGSGVTTHPSGGPRLVGFDADAEALRYECMSCDVSFLTETRDAYHKREAMRVRVAIGILAVLCAWGFYVAVLW